MSNIADRSAAGHRDVRPGPAHHQHRDQADGAVQGLHQLHGQLLRRDPNPGAVLAGGEEGGPGHLLHQGGQPGRGAPAPLQPGGAAGAARQEDAERVPGGHHQGRSPHTPGL